jgi:uncharacterized protein
MSVFISKISKAALFIDGVSYAGRAEELELPKLTGVFEEHKALGMAGAVELPVGLEKLTGKIKWLDVTAAMATAANIYDTVKIQARASVDVFTSEGRTLTLPCVVTMTAFFKNSGGGTLKQAESLKQESDLAIIYYKVNIASVDVTEVDMINNVYKVNAKDLLLLYKVVGVIGQAA